MTAMLPAHIVAGSAGIVAGSLALFSLKGGDFHRCIGKAFVVAMTVMALTAIAISIGPDANPGNVLMGSLTIYLAVSGFLTLHHDRARVRRIEAGLALGATALVLSFAMLGALASASPTGEIGSYTPAMFFVFGSVALLAVVGDARLVYGPELRPARRLTRHLWRMCFALFIATMSFFVGQAQVIPSPIRIMPLLIVLGVAPLIVMAYWLWRIGRRARVHDRAARASYGAETRRVSVPV